MQLHLMLSGYHAGVALREGPQSVRCTVYGRLRPLLGRRTLTVGVWPQSQVNDVLTTLFRVYPTARDEVLDRVWDGNGSLAEDTHAMTPIYVPRPGWRVLLNGRDVRYGGGLTLPVASSDEVAIFPPGR